METISASPSDRNFPKSVLTEEWMCEERIDPNTENNERATQNTI